MTQKERMMAGMLYDPGDKEIMDEQWGNLTPCLPVQWKSGMN